MKQEPLRLTVLFSIIVCIIAIIVSIFIMNEHEKFSAPVSKVINAESFISDTNAKHEYLIIRVDEKFGFANIKGEQVSKQLYDVLSIADNGMYYFKLDAKQGFIGENLDIVFETEEIIATNFSEEFVIYSSNDKKGYINIITGEKIEAKYDAAHDFSEGLAAVQSGNATGFINTEGKLVIPCKFSNNAIYEFKSGLCNVMTGSLEKNNLKAFYIDKEGNNVFGKEFDYCMPFSENRAFVSKNGLWYIIDSEGNKVGDQKFGPYEKTVPSMFKEGCAVVVSEGKYGIVGLDGQYVVTPQYEQMSEITEGGVVYKQDGLYGYMNVNGSIIITPRYESLSNFKNGLAVYSQDHKYGVIDRAATVVVNAEYEDISLIDNELIKISLNDSEFYYIDKYGRIVYQNSPDEESAA